MEGRPNPATARPPERFVRRPRVAAFLDDCPSYAATLLVGPAGSGKTAAVAAYTERARAAGITVTWLRPDRQDVIAGAVADAVAREEPPVLVVDDAHLLCEEGTAVLVTALTEQPEAVRLVLVARQELTWVPVSAVLSGDVRALPADDLRFTPEEAADLVRLHLPPAGADDIAAVVEQADGWAAALVLSARALGAAGSTADARVALAATRRPMLDYLMHEVFASFSPDLVQVLLTTCRLDHVAADEAVLLSGIPDAGGPFDQAAAAGLLVTGYRDQDSHGWRYHPLLRDLLRRRTERAGPDWAAVVEAHHRAFEEYADRRDAERALLHARLSEDLDLQLRAIREFAADLVARRRPELVAEALGAIPVDVRSHHQELLVLHATVLRALGRVDAAKVAADRALAADARSLAGPVSRDVEAELAALELWQARFGWREAAPAIDRAERVLGCRHVGTASAHDLTDISPIRAHWLISELAAFQTWLGDLDVASIHLQDVAMYASRAHLPLLEGAVLAQRAVVEMVAGSYQSGQITAETALAVLTSVPSPSQIAEARAHLATGWGRLQRLDMTGAEQSLEAFEATPRDQLEPLLLVYGRLLRACLLSASGRSEDAERLLAGRGGVPELLPPRIDRDDRMVRMLITVTMGDLAGLARAAREMHAARLDAAAALADALHTGLSGEEQRAVRMLDALVPATVDAPVTVGLGAAVTRVAFLQRIGTASALETAHRLLPDVLARAATQRLLFMLSLGSLLSPTFTDLLGAHAAMPGGHPFAAEAYAALSARPRPYPDLTPHRTGVNGVALAPNDPALTLTPREREVLEQLALGGGNADLARSLFVSENTVKTHLASIYRKLAVDRRVDALRVARDRGLL